MKWKTALALLALVGIIRPTMSHASAPEIIGSWKVEVTFQSGEHRSLRFEARDGGKGSLQLLIPKPLQAGPNEPAAAEWTSDDAHSFTFSGPVQFPLGNVGIQRGRLVLRGKLETDGSMKGEARFFPAAQEPANATGPPSKHGTFTASRTNS